jgi:hypothetical protein
MKLRFVLFLACYDLMTAVFSCRTDLLWLLPALLSWQSHNSGAYIRWGDCLVQVKLINFGLRLQTKILMSWLWNGLHDPCKLACPNWLPMACFTSGRKARRARMIEQFM